MYEQYEILSFLIGLLIRFGIPIIITAVVILLLKQLDKQWQSEAESSQAKLATAKAKNIGCWDINKCPPELRAKCNAYAHPDTPCWQVFRESSGQLQEKCLLCKVFKKAPIPVPA